MRRDSLTVVPDVGAIVAVEVGRIPLNAATPFARTMIIDQVDDHGDEVQITCRSIPPSLEVELDDPETFIRLGWKTFP